MNTIDLKTIGHELIDMLHHAGGGHHVPAWLEMDESGAQRSLVRCPACGAEANSGTFKLLHRYRRSGVVLPYLAVHVLAVHGVVEIPGAAIAPDELATLRDVLNHPEREVAHLLVGVASLAAPIPYVHVAHHEAKGYVACDTCGDRINMGHLSILHGGEETLSLPYPAVHALFEHRDARYCAESISGQVRLDEIQSALSAPISTSRRGS